MGIYTIISTQFIRLATAYFFYKTTVYILSCNEIHILYEHYVNIIDLLTEFNDQLLLDYDTKDTNVDDKQTDDVPSEVTKPLIKYEDKYLDKFRKMINAYEFTEDEQQLYDKLVIEYVSTVKEDDENKDESDDENKDEEESSDNNTNKEWKVFFSEEESIEKATNYVINERLDKLINNIIIETTPLGNVIMMYNNKKEVFEYYCDNTVPYRFLETVARKYVLTYFCRPLYIVMEEELKESEKKLVEQQNKEKRKAEEELANKSTIVPKKSVFAKFKSYNKEALSGQVNKAAPPKNSIPNNTSTNNDKPILLKERANRYNFQGKIANFSLLKKVDKKLVNKKLAMTFSDFKKTILV
jgi:hypothetical protein